MIETHLPAYCSVFRGNRDSDPDDDGGLRGRSSRMDSRISEREASRSPDLTREGTLATEISRQRHTAGTSMDQSTAARLIGTYLHGHRHLFLHKIMKNRFFP